MQGTFTIFTPICSPKHKQLEHANMDATI